MSVSDPSIKDIKGHLLVLFQESTGRKITDSSRNLINYCQALEKIFHTGATTQNQKIFQNKNNDPYSWMCCLPIEKSSLVDFKYRNSVEDVQNCKNVCTPLGKFRLLIRHCLMKKCLHFPLQCLYNSNKFNIFYERNSIIGDEILSAIFLSVLLQSNKINFDLKLENSYFLDTTWQIPDLVRLELVPSNSLGISISFSENKAIIVDITPNSVASESVDISSGDVLANLNGVDVTFSCKGRLKSILQLTKGRPINLAIIKALDKEKNVFWPMKNILRNLHIDINGTNSQPNAWEPDVTSASGVSIIQNIKNGYRGEYVGSVNVGKNGSVKHIEEAIRRSLHNKDYVKKSIIFEIGEMSIKIFDVETGEIILKHSYMQISSCGSTPNLPNYIAYIAGAENCDTASNFTCYVFYINDVEDGYVILQSMGQGFFRTHFAV